MPHTDATHGRHVTRSRTKAVNNGGDQALRGALERAAANGTLAEASLRRILSDLRTLSRLKPCIARGVAPAIVGAPTELYACIARTWSNASTRANKVSACVSALKHGCPAGPQSTRVAAARAFWNRALVEASAVARANVGDAAQSGGATIRKASAPGSSPNPKLDPTRLREAVATLASTASTSLGASQDHLWLSIALMVPPKRADWGAVRIVPTADEVRAGENALIVPRRGPATLVLQRYKTCRSAGRYEEALPDAVSSTVRHSLREFPRAHLFVDARGRPFQTNNSWTQWVKRAFQRAGLGNHSINGLRKVWAAGIPMGTDASAVAARKELVRRMT